MKEMKRGQFLSECRKKKKLSQEQLGAMINYSRNNISKWENGISFPGDPNVLEKLSEIFNVSIEELMYGEYRSKNNDKDIVDNLVHEYKNKYKTLVKRNIVILSLILSLILIIITSIYLIFIRGTISVYTLSFDSDDFSMQDSVLVLSNTISTFHFNKIESKHNEKINKIKIYYYDDNEEKIIFSGDNDDYFIEESNGYGEYNLQNLKIFDLFLSVETEDEEYKDIKLDISRKYINDKIFPKKDNKIGNIKNNPSRNLDYKEILENEGFKTDDNIYFSKQINNYVYVSIEERKIRLSLYNEEANSIEYLESIDDNNQILYTKTENGKEIESNLIQVTSDRNCNKEKCSSIDDYASYIVYIKNVIN